MSMHQEHPRAEEENLADEEDHGRPAGVWTEMTIIIGEEVVEAVAEEEVIRATQVEIVVVPRTQHPLPKHLLSLASHYA